MKSFKILLSFSLLCMPLFSHAENKGKYENFKVSIYTRAYEVQSMTDPAWLDSTWNIISSQMKVDKIYLETHRDLNIVKADDMKRIIKFFKDRGVEVAGGITYTISEANNFQTFCYKNPEERAKAKEIIELTASLFDEIILDDFFFTDCKCDYCVEAKGNRTWTDYRLELMDDAALNVILGPAKKVNKNVKVVIKYPNWYDHFPALGFDLDFGPKHFDGIYTGTETRDAVRSNQHLQPYESYLIWRYFDNLNPGHNGGGWVDTGGMRYMERYAEQLWLTVFAKAPEMTFFDYRQMLGGLRSSYRGPWQDAGGTSFNYDEMMKPVNINGKEVTPTTMARAAGYTMEQVDRTIGLLGNPIGVKSYKPYQSTGEEFLQNYFGMIGIPMDIVPEFPTDANMVILTEQAAADADIIKKMDKHLRSGKDITITAGFLRAMKGKGIESIVDLEYTDRKALVSGFMTGGQIVNVSKPILMQQVMYKTNDSWEIVSGMDGGLGWPLLHRDAYSKGNVYLLVVPDNFADLYNLPVQVLNSIRQNLTQKAVPVRIQGPANVSLFIYDNNTFIVESFSDEDVDITVQCQTEGALKDLLSGEDVNGSRVMQWGRSTSNERSFRVHLKPHSYRVFKF
jgi:hypothetical protein